MQLFFREIFQVASGPSHIHRLIQGEKPQAPADHRLPGDLLQRPAVGRELGPVLLRPGRYRAPVHPVGLEVHHGDALQSLKAAVHHALEEHLLLRPGLGVVVRRRNQDGELELPPQGGGGHQLPPQGRGEKGRNFGRVHRLPLLGGEEVDNLQIVAIQ